MTTRAERAEAFRLKNQRRKEKDQHTLYAKQGREARRLNGGVFGDVDPDTFNKFSEGTAATKRASS